ncbi:hypothetical protein AC1031_014969 [Aphanomyces cochlioides]|nr:hypothetical protein AC1031_014969 [Aphanomyces cochlioides]
MSSPHIAPRKGSSGCGIPLFIQRLYNLLEDAPHDIVNWAEDGQSFTIYRPTQFASHVLAIFFGHRKLETFMRMLNYYGFHKCRSKHLMEFSHLSFQRGNLAGLTQIRRRFKQDLEPDDREIVEDIEEMILDIARHLERERRLDELAMRECIECLLQPSPALPSLPPPCHSPCATPRPTSATTCETPAFKQISYHFPQ